MIISKKDRVKNIFRWIARILSSLVALFLIIMVLGEIVFNIDDVTFEGVMVVTFAIILTASVIQSWFREKIGGWILTVSAISFAVFIYITAGTNRILASTLISLPFWASGIMFLIAGQHKKRGK